MPIYEYKCQKCGKEYELFQGIADPAQKSCKFCRGPVKKLVSLSSFQLTGSGWYVTDYGGKKPPCAKDGKKEDAAPSAPKESCSGSEGKACDSCQKK
jgi:putative FmdB family regulatory protein